MYYTTIDKTFYYLLVNTIIRYSSLFSFQKAPLYISIIATYTYLEFLLQMSSSRGHFKLSIAITDSSSTEYSAAQYNLVPAASHI